MESNDEDFSLFIQEFGELLNKYHYIIRHSIKMAKLHSEASGIGFQADGEYIWQVVFDAKTGEFYSCKRTPTFDDE